MDSLKSKEVLNIMKKCHEIKMSRKQMTIVKCSKFEIDEVFVLNVISLKFSRITNFRTTLAIQLTF